MSDTTTIEMAREWLDREGRMHDTLGRVVRVNLRDAGLDASLAALLDSIARAATEAERDRCIGIAERTIDRNDDEVDRIATAIRDAAKGET